MTRDNTVTISAVNFTTDDTYTVRMNYYHTQGVAGFIVDSQVTDATGAFTATYTIPDSLKGENQIAIRLESDNSVYYSYNWFWNNDHP